MAILFRCLAARWSRWGISASLAVPACCVAILLAPQLAFSPSAVASVLYLPELCALSVEELLRVRVIGPDSRYSHRGQLIDLELEELLTIKAVRLTYNDHTAGEIEELQQMQRIERGLKGRQ